MQEPLRTIFTGFTGIRTGVGALSYPSTTQIQTIMRDPSDTLRIAHISMYTSSSAPAPTCTARPVHILLQRGREVEVEDVAERGNVNASGGDFRRHTDPEAAACQTRWENEHVWE